MARAPSSEPFSLITQSAAGELPVLDCRCERFPRGLRENEYWAVEVLAVSDRDGVERVSRNLDAVFHSIAVTRLAPMGAIQAPDSGHWYSSRYLLMRSVDAGSGRASCRTESNC